MIVISLLFDHAPGALANHRRYARLHGYHHVEIDMSELPGNLGLIRWLYKYETLLHHLNQAAANEIVLLLDENAAIVRPVELPPMMAGRDWLLTHVERDTLQTSVLMFRNTEAVRNKLADVVRRCRLGIDVPQHEADVLRDMAPCPERFVIGETMVVAPAAASLQSVWATWNVFAICFSDEPHHRRFRSAVFAHINGCNTRGVPYLSLPDTGVRETDAHSVYQPGRAIAVVTLYTPNVAKYGRIAEANFRRYCERHGYTLYVHREIPAQMNDGKSAGNWFKAALLRDVLPQHQWVFWLDADVLVNDMNRRLEPLTHGRETVLARDMGAWTFNSGIMGFQRNQRNYDALARVMNDSAHIADKSSVYVNHGDQLRFIEAFAALPEFDAAQVMSLVDLNTPWIYRRPDTFMVHYMGMWEDNRALMMEYDLKRAAME